MTNVKFTNNFYLKKNEWLIHVKPTSLNYFVNHLKILSYQRKFDEIWQDLNPTMLSY